MTESIDSHPYGSIEWDVSGDRQTWYRVDNVGWIKNFTAPYPTKIWVRAILRTTDPGVANNPVIDQVSLTTTHDTTTYPTAFTSTAYIRTNFYSPRTEK